MRHIAQPHALQHEVSAFTYIHTYIHTYIYTYIYIYINRVEINTYFVIVI